MEQRKYEILDIFYQSHRIPAGVFDSGKELIRISSGFGRRQLRMYLRDSRDVLSRYTAEENNILITDRNGSLWCRIPEGNETVLFGPVQTGINPSFSYSGIREYSYDLFADIAACLVRLLKGADAEIRSIAEDYASRKLAGIPFESEMDNVELNSFDEVFECVRSGDIRQLAEILDSPAFLSYLDAVMQDWDKAQTVFVFNLAKTYHTALGSGVPISDLSPLIQIHLEEQKRCYTLAGLKSDMHRMLYDFTRYVSQYRDTRHSSAVNMALMYIREHIYSRIRVEDIARYCTVSVSSLQHKFKAETGMPVSDKIREYKTEKACFFLKHTALPCSDIALKLGYSGQSHFVTQFKKASGMTPTEYRARTDT